MPSPFPRRRARKLRHPDKVVAHWYEYVLGEDEHGVWAILPAGDPCWFASGDISRLQSDQMWCYPREAWWTAQFWQPDRIQHIESPDGTKRSRTVPVLIYADMSTPPLATEDDVSFVDLVLDVMRDGDDRVMILDEDEVEEEVERYGIPGEYIEAARATCPQVYAAMSARQAPFDGKTADAWRAKFHEAR